MRNQSFVKLVVVILVAFVVQANTVQAQNVDDVVNKHLTAMGGDKYTGIKSIKMEAIAQIMGMELPSNTTIVQGRGMHSKTTVQGSDIVQAIDGKTGWMINPMMGSTNPVALTEDQVKMSAGQLDLTGLFNYKTKGYKAELTGEDKVEGAPVYVVKVDMGNGALATHYISKDTYYILKSVVNTNVQGQDVELKTNFSNFKQVDGVTFPFTTEIESPAMPGPMTMLVKNVEVNPRVDESIFAMPKN